jgi:nitrogen fixation protein
LGVNFYPQTHIEVAVETKELIRIMETGKGVIVKLKEYECVEVKHHKDVGRTIKEWQKNGWRLHTYQTAGIGARPMSYIVNHYLLFEKGE